MDARQVTLKSSQALKKDDIKNRMNTMSDRVDRDVINALIEGHFADPFPCWDAPYRGRAGSSGVVTGCDRSGSLSSKTGRKVANLECLDSRGFFSGIMPRRKNPFVINSPLSGTASKT